MELSALMDSIEGLSAEIAALYTEKNGKYELTGIKGVKTPADIERLQSSLGRERDEHKATKEKYKQWDGFEYDDVVSKLDKYPELEAAAGGKLDEAAIEDLVSKRVDGTLKSRMAPVERQLADAQKANETLAQENAALKTEKTNRIIGDQVRQQLVETKAIPHAHEDAMFLAERVFEVTEDGQVLTKDGVGVTPGSSVKDWIMEMQPKRPHWWPESNGGGASGGSSGQGGAANPWKADNWNVTEQGKYLRAHGVDRATAAAKAAGTTLGGLKPIK